MVREKFKKKEKKRSIYMEMCGTVKRKEETVRRIKKIRRRKFLSEKKKSNKKNIKSHNGSLFWRIKFLVNVFPEWFIGF